MAKKPVSEAITDENLFDEPEKNPDSDSNGTNSDAAGSARRKMMPNSLVLRIGVFSAIFIVMVLTVSGFGSLIVKPPVETPAVTLALTSSVEPLPDTVSTPIFSTEGKTSGIYRLSEIENVESPYIESREEVSTYIVQTGDTIFGIADKFGLKPETVLWSNRYIIGDTPDGLVPGLELYILPEDGLYHMWSEGEGLNGVAEFYGVDPDVIVNYPLNGLDPQTIGDYANPRIEPGKMLVVPGGTRPTVAWIVARDNPASGNAYLGPGACGGIIYGNVGTGTFTWPTTATWLSGYDYSPPVHNGLDFDGDFGSPIYAADTGVIVYSGWSDRGYGNLIVVDHDSGWQTFYAHLLDDTLLPCWTNVQKGQMIAAMGSTGKSTGPHLHFELRLNGHPMDPWQFLN